LIIILFKLVLILICYK